jgi:hypothetical protein
MSPQKKKQKRSAISQEIKKEICLYAKQNLDKSHNEISNHFNTKYTDLSLKRSTISKILKDKEKWENLISTENSTKVFRERSVKFPHLEKAIGLWISQVSAGGLTISDNILCEKARAFAQALDIPEKSLSLSNGWLMGFKQRNNLRSFILHGEANSAPLEILPQQRKIIQELLSSYELENIYNADETGLFYRMTSNQTLATGPVKGKKKVKYIFYLNNINNIILFF